MPDKPLTVATYAAGASLAAITLVYVFAPTYFIDSDSNSQRKKGVVGLTNPANDCFINSVLQALAGLTDLRVYLIRETHRRHIDEPWVYLEPVEIPTRRDTPRWKIEGLQAGLVTEGLKQILDALNERPIYKKTISAAGFVKVLETAFKQRISRQQQDAQEFLQVVAERLCDEYHAGKRARQHARRKAAVESSTNGTVPIDTAAIEQRLSGLDVKQNGDGGDESRGAVPPRPKIDTTEIQGDPLSDEDEAGFPMEGRYESQIECQTCGFKPKPTESTFCTLTLNVPQASSTSLNACLDGMFKTEYVDDFKCEKCRLVHAKEALEADLARSTSETFKATAMENIRKLQHAIDTDPEQPPADVELPDTRFAPKRKIARHTRVTSFPKVLAIHLSRSIYDASMSTKNSAKVSFPERLPMGGLMHQKKYKLIATVNHKGSHNSGHYESFRRQNVAIPFSTPHPFQQSSAFTKSAQPSPAPSPQVATPQIATPQILALQKPDQGSPLASTPDLLSPTVSSGSPSTSAEELPRPAPDRIPRSSPSSKSSHTNRSANSRERDSDAISVKSVAASAKSTLSRISHSVKNSRPNSPAGKITSNGTGILSNGSTVVCASNGKAVTSATKSRRKKPAERWWRISDEKVKEAKTHEVIGMQREVYLLFYELEERSGTSSTES
jgi:ubiquitin carboxyl-terminal hydrolase 16